MTAFANLVDRVDDVSLLFGLCISCDSEKEALLRRLPPLAAAVIIH